MFFHLQILRLHLFGLIWLSFDSFMAPLHSPFLKDYNHALWKMQGGNGCADGHGAQDKKAEFIKKPCLYCPE